MGEAREWSWRPQHLMPTGKRGARGRNPALFCYGFGLLGRGVDMSLIVLESVRLARTKQQNKAMDGQVLPEAPLSSMPEELEDGLRGK